MGAFLAGAAAGYGIAMPVGAIGVLIAGLSARHSLRVGAAAGLGAATADGLYALAAVLGGAAVAGIVAPFAGPLRMVAAVTLVALAVVTAVGAIRRRARPPEDRSRPVSPGAAYSGILALTLLNPATVVYFAALVLGRGGRFGGGGAWFVTGAFLASASWQLFLAGGGSLVGRLLVGPRGRLITALVSSAVIAALGIGLL
ncbi:LysE family transporter [Mangrovihabitans endophyticus]|uniref:Lysine transporter LysE n=1 Tax=Mangrovihabitans endophyticus TaxID=1751298 RepID=A0A8J3FMA1_9ACTN|nr:LysE family transporter [Mangrovihabitans endophyticus]GGK71677.1 lysine transporter LysE [Mangrovihabitans endophyticus]